MVAVACAAWLPQALQLSASVLSWQAIMRPAPDAAWLPASWHPLTHPSACPCLSSLRDLQLALEMKDEAIEMLRGYEARCR